MEAEDITDTSTTGKTATVGAEALTDEDVVRLIRGG